MSVFIDDVGKKHFDLRTHLRDPKTGQVVKHQPYRMLVDKETGVVFERAGIKYFPNGVRVDGKKIVEAPVEATKVVENPNK